MKTLLLLRHAKSSGKDVSIDDHDRPLNKKGKRDAPRVGRVLLDEGLVPDVILSSTAIRAMNTADMVAEASGYGRKIEVSGLLYHAEPDVMTKILCELPDEHRNVMLVGHNPGLKKLLETLTGRYQPVPTAALVQVQLDVENWKELDSKLSGQLIKQWLPHELPKEGKFDGGKVSKGKKSKKNKKNKKNKRQKAFDLRDMNQNDGDAVQISKKITNRAYLKELSKLQIELVHLQEWIKEKGLKVVVVFEGRDAAGKGGVIKRIADKISPRVCRVVALPAPTEREQTQWYFQRYITHLPAAGEIVLFDRSWYNRAGVERVMGFCADEQYEEFMRSCPQFEEMLVRSGIILIKYWFSVSDHVQEQRFKSRIDDPTKQWKLSPMDLESRSRWVEYSQAKDKMFAKTDTRLAPWHVVMADNKKRARLNCISHLLSMIPYKALPHKPIKLPKRDDSCVYVRPPLNMGNIIPEVF